MEVFIHIGTIKTGTSSIQQVFAKNYDALLAQGTLYPKTAGPHVHSLIPAFFFKGQKGNRLFQVFQQTEKKYTSYEHFLERFLDELDQEIKQSGCQKIVISSEHLSRVFLDPDALPIVDSILKFFQRYDPNPKVILYVREQASILTSHYSTVLKGGLGGMNLKEYFEKRGDSYDYCKLTAPWLQTFGPDNVVCRVFHRSLLLNGDVIDDIANILSIDCSQFIGIGQDANKSMSAEMAHILVGFNEQVPQFIKSQLNPIRGSLNLVIENSDSGESKIKLKQAELEKLQKMYADSNSVLSQDFSLKKFEVSTKDVAKDNEVSIEKMIKCAVNLAAALVYENSINLDKTPNAQMLRKNQKRFYN